jgi:hypothetical protein
MRTKLNVVSPMFRLWGRIEPSTEHHHHTRQHTLDSTTASIKSATQSPQQLQHPQMETNG